MPKIKSMKYFIGNTGWKIADVTIDYEMYEKLGSEDLDKWMTDIATSCPLYVDYKEEIANHTANYIPQVIEEEENPF